MAINLHMNLYKSINTQSKWTQMTLSRTHMNAALCFNLCFTYDNAERLTFMGYFTDKDGTKYDYQNNVILSEKATNALCSLKPHTLPGKRRKTRLPFQVSDKGDVKLMLYYENSKEKEKELTDEFIETVLQIITEDLQNTITSYEQITLSITGMRSHIEYELISENELSKLTLYQIISSKNTYEKMVQKSVECENKEIIDLLNSCALVRWDGFHGAHPKDVLDGQMFSLTATVNEGQRVRAEGSENFPAGYKTLIRSLNQILNR